MGARLLLELLIEWTGLAAQPVDFDAIYYAKMKESQLAK